MECHDNMPTVVVIGNSPTALISELGDQINNFDKVIRVNKCVTAGYEKFIGTKTDIWSTTTTRRWNNFFPNEIIDKRIWFRSSRTLDHMSKKGQLSQISKELGYDPRIDMLFKEASADKLLIDFFKEFDIEEIKSRMIFRGPDHFIRPTDIVNDRSDEAILNYTTIKYWLRTLNYEPCTGLLTILRAVAEFEKVAILGFTFSTDDINGGSFEYYRKDEISNKTNLTSDEHSKNQKEGSSSIAEGMKKINLLKSLVDKGKIILLNPDELNGIKIDVVDRKVIRVR